MTNLSPPKQGMLTGVLTWVSSSSALLWATFLMEAMWFYLWMIWLGQWDSFGIGEMPFTPFSILLILWASYYVVQIIGATEMGRGQDSSNGQSPSRGASGSGGKTGKRRRLWPAGSGLGGFRTGEHGRRIPHRPPGNPSRRSLSVVEGFQNLPKKDWTESRYSPPSK